jgi:predicted RNase H-like HicB family nuclease
MTNLKSKTILIFDNGIFVEFAVTLAKYFGRVLYFCPWTNGYPTSRGLLIGAGIEGVERIKEPWSYIDAVDLFVFPDCYEGDLQQYLVDQGKRVWGCRRGSELELDRVHTKELMRKVGLDVGPYEVVVGLDALRKYLKKHDDQYVKIDATRGDVETFHSPTYEEIEPRLDELEHNLGAKKKIMEFIVEEGIRPALETGYDGYCIDGKYPRSGLIGIEIKDRAFVARTMKYPEMPEPVRRVNDGLAPAMKGYGYRGFLSTEVRCTEDGKAYLIDFTARAGSPPSELYQIMIENLGEVIWYGSEGIMIEPEWKAKWGAEVLMLSEWADKNWAHVRFPPEVRDNVKLRNFSVIDGEYYIVPQLTGMPEIGSVVAMGDTAAEAIGECKRIAELVKSHTLDMPVEAMDEALEDLKEVLGKAAEDRKKSKLEIKAEDLKRQGKISEKQYDRLVARVDADQ